MAALGLDRVIFLTSGSAPLHLDTAMTFLGMGIPIMQGYGQTETSPVTSVSRLSENVYGAVGRPIAGVDVKIAPDGEVLVRGRNVMQGYYRDPEATSAAIVDGWLHTGDVGEIDADGFLRITDRKDEIFKTGTGKWVSPARIEANIKRSIFVLQAHGGGQRAAVSHRADLSELAARALELPSLPSDATPEELAARDDVHAFMIERGSPADARPGDVRADPARGRGSARVQRRGRRALAVDEDQAPRRRARYAAEIERAYGDTLVRAAL